MEKLQGYYPNEKSLQIATIKNLQSLNWKFRSEIDSVLRLRENIKEHLEATNNLKTPLTEEEFLQIESNLFKGDYFDKATFLRFNRVTYVDKEGEVHYLNIFKDEWCSNSFEIYEEVKDNEGFQKSRYDLVLAINGFPISVIELKKQSVNYIEAFQQMQSYRSRAFSGYFEFVQIGIVSNGTFAKYTAMNEKLSEKFLFSWANKSDENSNPKRLEGFVKEFLSPCDFMKFWFNYMILDSETRTLIAMRDYQVNATTNILNEYSTSKKGGYVWHTTGSGKTITAFKVAKLLSNIESVYRVLFIVDRDDLNNQTLLSFQNYTDVDIDETNNTRKLIEQLTNKGSNKLIVTTIQKMTYAIKNFPEKISSIKDENMVFMYDECHRTQFGENRKSIDNFYSNVVSYGFTGTPIFPVNSDKGDYTTEEVFGTCLDKYLIQDAIEDGNVLPFKIDYYNNPENNTNRAEKTIDMIVSKHKMFTRDNKFNGMLTVSRIANIINYYDIIKSKNSEIKVAAIYSLDRHATYGDDKSILEKTSEIIKDYNEKYGTFFSIDTHKEYIKDVQKRFKKYKKGNPDSIDLMIVDGMCITGYDSKETNTIYVDRELRYHQLIQTISRVNRVTDASKPHGNVIFLTETMTDEFGNVKTLMDKHVEEALRLFGGDKGIQGVILVSYSEQLKKTKEALARFRAKFKTEQDVYNVIDNKNSVSDMHDFIVLFRNLNMEFSKLTQYIDYTGDEFGSDLKKGEIEIYTQVYIEIRNFLKNMDLNDDSYNMPEDVKEVDIDVELLNSIKVNFQYIKEILKGYKREYIKISGKKDSSSKLAELKEKYKKSLRTHSILPRFIPWLDSYIDETNSDNINSIDVDNFIEEKIMSEIDEISKEAGVDVKEVKSEFNRLRHADNANYIIKPSDFIKMTSIEEPSRRREVRKHLEDKINLLLKDIKMIGEVNIDE
jgi:type I restriction enzyme R subunit